MRQIGLVGAFAVVILLVRCGEADRPRAAIQLTVSPEPTAAPAQISQPAVIPEVGAAIPRRPTRLEVVRALARSLGSPTCGCGRMILVDETGAPLPGQESHQVKEFRALGEDALADCEFILSDPRSTWEEINGVCEIITRFETGRRFVPLLVQRLATPDAMVPGDGSFDDIRKFLCRPVIYTLEELGDERDAWVLVRVLQRQEKELWRDAALALAKIGGQHELEAMNVWLAGQNPDAPWITRFRQYRDQFESRLLARPRHRSF